MALLYSLSVLSLGFLEAFFLHAVNFESHTEPCFLSCGLLMKQEQQTANDVSGTCLPHSTFHCQLQVIAISEPFMPV